MGKQNGLEHMGGDNYSRNVKQGDKNISNFKKKKRGSMSKSKWSLQKKVKLAKK